MKVIITMLNSNSAEIGMLKLKNLIKTKNPCSPADKQEIINSICRLYFEDKHISYVINQTLQELIPLIDASKFTKESVYIYVELLTSQLINKIIKEEKHDNKF